jgi:hypothetical protein
VIKVFIYISFALNVFLVVYTQKIMVSSEEVLGFMPANQTSLGDNGRVWEHLCQAKIWRYSFFLLK